MSQIVINRQHTLSQTECHELSLSIVEHWKKSLGGNVRIDGNTIHYKHAVSGTSGLIESSDNELVIKVKLGFMMGLMKPKIEQEIHRLCDESLAQSR